MPPRYLSLVEAIERVLRELGGEARVDTVLREVWKRYAAGGESGERVVMRLYVHPSGRIWSPEAEEALRILEAAGVIQRRDGLIVLRRIARSTAAAAGVSPPALS